ncbi:MAG TPA: S8 family serine peptidase [Thermoanaerobaculia bacterium]
MIRREEVSHVQWIENLEDKLHGLDLAVREDLQFRFVRVRVPEGEEQFKVNYLQFYYKAMTAGALLRRDLDPERHGDLLFNSGFHFQAVPNSVLSVTAGAAPGVGFNFSPYHTRYRTKLGWNAAQVGFGKKVMVLDTGVDPAFQQNILSRKNFVDPASPGNVDDDHGHGTAVASIIGDLCPTADFIIYKVADGNGRASEWDVLAALAADGPAEIVNISLAFGLQDTHCPRCGRESRSSRSAVFETLIHDLEEKDAGPLVVAAAGNKKDTSLAFPARFKDVVAIASINDAGDLSDFTNRSVTDHEGNPHQNVFVLPGGEKVANNNPSEYVGDSAAGHQFWGTSFSAAYASGLIAGLWSRPEHAGKDRQDMLKHLRNKADAGHPTYVASTHGNGLMRFA